MTGPLHGIRVLDLSRILAGPFATQQLLDLGADVIKVESPEGGDDTRAWGPPFVEDGRSTYFLAANRGKRSIVIDLEKEDGQQIVRRLAARADVVIENFRHGQLARWALDLASLRRDHPRLVTCRISGFGDTGPRADEGGYDALVQAMSGLMSITGPGPGPWSKVGVAVVDIVTGLFASTSILALLAGRDADPARQDPSTRHVEVSL